MTAETVQTTPPAFATVAALEAHITAMGHTLSVLWAESQEYVSICDACGAKIDEDDAGVSVDERLLGPCVEPLWVNYTFKENCHGHA